MTPRRPKSTLAVTITLDLAGHPDELLLEALEPITEALADHGAAVALDLDPATITVDVEIESTTPNPLDADDIPAYVAGLAQDVLADVLDADRPTVTGVVVQTPQQRDLDLERTRVRNDLVGVSEVAEMRDVVVQSAHRTTKREDFPTPVLTIKAGSLWSRKAVERFFTEEDLRRARPTPAPITGITPNLQTRRTIGALLAGQPNLPADVATAVTRPHLLTGPTLTAAITLLGGPKDLAAKLDVTPRTVQRWLAGAKNAS